MLDSVNRAQSFDVAPPDLGGLRYVCDNGPAIRRKRAGKGFFVARLYKADFVLTDPQRFHDAVNAVSRQPKDDIYSPIHQALDKNIGCSHFRLRIVV